MWAEMWALVLDRQLEFVTNLVSQMAWMLANLTLMGSLLAVIFYVARIRDMMFDKRRVRYILCITKKSEIRIRYALK